MFDIQLILMAHDLRCKIILEYRTAKSCCIRHIIFDECGSKLKMSRSRHVSLYFLHYYWKPSLEWCYSIVTLQLASFPGIVIEKFHFCKPSIEDIIVHCQNAPHPTLPSI
jgi:hypothetical protein